MQHPKNCTIKSKIFHKDYRSFLQFTLKMIRDHMNMHFVFLNVLYLLTMSFTFNDDMSCAIAS